MFRKKINTFKEKMADLGSSFTMLVTGSKKGLFRAGPTRTIYTESYIPNNYYSVILGNIDKSLNGEIFMKNPTAIAPTK